MLFLFWLGLGELGSGLPGRYHQGKGLRYRMWIRDTVVATANLDGIFGSGDGKRVGGNMVWQQNVVPLDRVNRVRA
jgi:hypothetical protein